MCSSRTGRSTLFGVGWSSPLTSPEPLSADSQAPEWPVAECGGDAAAADSLVGSADGVANRDLDVDQTFTVCGSRFLPPDIFIPLRRVDFSCRRFFVPIAGGPPSDPPCRFSRLWHATLQRYGRGPQRGGGHPTSQRRRSMRSGRIRTWRRRAKERIAALPAGTAR